MYRYSKIIFHLTLTWVAIFFSACSGDPHHQPPHTLDRIAIQPVDFKAGDPDLQSLAKEIDSFYHCPVIILPVKSMPPGFLNLTKGKRYSADSILKWLAPQCPDSISLITALTSKDIYIADKDRSGHIKQPESKYAIWGILGLGYSPGRVNIVSDHRFRGTSPEKYHHRLRTIVIHEIGHNLGLPHCPTPHCIMNDANETIATVDASDPTLCPACSSQIQKIHKFY